MNVQEIIEEIKKLKGKVNKSNMKSYNFELAERIILRLNSFPECNECRAFIDEFASIIEELENNSSERVNKKYTLFQKRVLTHLEKKHKLITEGYYTNLYMACGIGIGLPLGFVFSQFLKQTAYIGIGLPIGIGIGLSIGSAKDAKAKKDGLII